MSAHKVIAGLTIVSAFALCFLLTPTFAEGELARDSRTGKLLNIFQVVRFPNDACNTTAGDQGVCYTATECTSRSGTNSGTCASGFGVCCSFSVKCGATTNQNNTYFSSSDTDTSPCTVKMCRSSSEVCQLRLDFIKFNVGQPRRPSTTFDSDVTVDMATQCQSAQFEFNGGTSQPNILCGLNTGQHIYIGADEACNVMSFTWEEASLPREWNIKITEIGCTSPIRAPPGCLQYYTAETGTIQSFNFDGGAHLANQNHLICIRHGKGKCQITYTKGIAFQLDENVQANTGAQKTRAAVGSGCGNDFVVIPSGYGTDPTVTFDRYCGNDLYVGTGKGKNDLPVLGSVNSRSLPFQVEFVSNDHESATDVSFRGFQLKYTQKAC